MSDLSRLIIEAQVLGGAPHPCQVLGHNWVFEGGSSCCCELTAEDGSPYLGNCSLPVYKCSVCDDYDYGTNAEADQIIEECNARHS